MFFKNPATTHVSFYMVLKSMVYLPVQYNSKSTKMPFSKCDIVKAGKYN